MGQAIILRRGGGGLNFKVTAIAEEGMLPKTARENTICISTNVPIGDWQIDSLVPVTRLDGSVLQEGDIWVENLRTSDVAVAVTKQRGIKIYPGAAKQYLAGTWVAKDAKIFQNGQWTPLLFYLIQKGKWNMLNTGGKLNVNIPSGSVYKGEDGYFTVTTNASADNSTGTGICVSTAKMVKTGMYDTLYLDSSVSGKDGYVRYMCGLATGTSYSQYCNPSIRTGTASSMVRAVRTLDITSVVADRYVRFEATTASSTLRMSQKVYNCWLA